LTDARRTEDAVQRTHDAARAHEAVTRYTAVAKAIGPQGVRARMLDKGMGALNNGLAHLASTADWPVVQIDPNGSVMIRHHKWSIGDRSVTLCSESEQWRAQACIQLTLAALSGSKVVVLDRADLLDASQRKGMVSALKLAAESSGLAVLVCSTGEPEPFPDWQQIVVEDGRTREAAVVL